MGPTLNLLHMFPIENIFFNQESRWNSEHENSTYVLEDLVDRQEYLRNVFVHLLIEIIDHYYRMKVDDDSSMTKY